MNKVGIYYAYWTHEWDADFHPFIDKVSELGFDVLEVNAGTVANMTSGERQRLKAHADDQGLTLSYCIGLPHEYDIASADKEVRDHGIAYLTRMAEAIGEMGGGMMGGIIYSAWPATIPVSFNAAVMSSTPAPMEVGSASILRAERIRRALTVAGESVGS